MSGTEAGFVAGWLLLAGGIIAFFSLRQALCGLLALIGGFAFPSLALSGLNSGFSREGGIVAAVIILAAIPVGFVVTWVAAHLLLPGQLLKKVPPALRKVAGASLFGLAIVIIVACW